MDFLLSAMKMTNNHTIDALLKLLTDSKGFDYQNFCNLYTSDNYTLKDNNLYTWSQYYFGGIDREMYNINKEDSYDKSTRISGIDIN